MNWDGHWELAIKRNSEALNGIVAALFVLLGDVAVARIPASLHLAVLRVLRPAESAVRRLIVIVARGLVVKPAILRSKPLGPIIGKGGGGSRLSFPLLDQRKIFAALRGPKFRRCPPRILFFGDDSRVDSLWPSPQPAPAPPPDGLVSAQRLSRRLQALKSALDDLPRQARRLARWRLKQAKMPDPKFTSPMRPGRPPGHRKRSIHEVDDVLKDCHALAWDALKPNTS